MFWGNHSLVLYLVGDGLVLEAWLVEDGFSLVFVEVRDADGLDQAVIHQLLHSLRTLLFLLAMHLVLQPNSYVHIY